MVSMPDMYGKRAKDKIPMPIEARIPLPQSTELHPAAQQAAVVYSEALMELDRLRQVNDRLSNDLEVERRSNEQLRVMLDQERNLKESYMRYSIQVKTDLGHIAEIAIKANNRARDHADTTRETALQNVDAALQEAVSHENGKGA